MNLYKAKGLRDIMKNTKTDYERILNEEKGNNYGTQLRNKELNLFNIKYKEWLEANKLEVKFEAKRKQ
jgi:hypothetical protein